MHLAVGLVALLATVLAGTVVSHRIRVPEPLLLLFVGTAVGYLPFVPDVELSPEFVLLGLLPPLLFAAAVNSSLVDFRSMFASIGMLSVGLVLFTAVGVGLVTWGLLPVPVAAAFALGAVVAPPDAVAATAVARRIGLPRRVVTLLEGESLVNDATAIVTLNTAIAAITTQVTVGHVAVSFLISAVGGVAVGTVVALVVNRLLPLMPETSNAVGLGLLCPWLAYLPAEHIHASGVLATVTCGLLIAFKAPYRQTAITRVSNRINWNTIQFALENTVFLLMGLQVKNVVTDLEASSLGWRTITVALIGIVAAVLLLRPLWILGGRALLAGKSALGWKEVTVMSWAGMRGVVTLAAAFVLPAETPHREVLVAAALVVVGGTLVLQGATLPWLARRLSVQGPDVREDALQEAQIMQSAARAGLEVLENLRDDPRHQLDHDMAEELRLRSDRRVNAIWERLGTGVDDALPPNEVYRRTRLKMLTAEREEVLRIRNTGGAEHEVLDGILYSFDIEESTLESTPDSGMTDPSTELRTPSTVAQCCEHLDEVAKRPEPDSPTEYCAACREEGLQPVHLRKCMNCGAIGCCDSSPGQHATRHHEQTGHPVMRSYEPGEMWRWCFVDEVLS